MALTPSSSKVWVIVVAAGSGVRFGAMKQFLELVGERVLDRAVATAARHSEGVVVVLPADVEPGPLALPTATATVVKVVAGGSSRAGSVRRGLAAVPTDATIVLVHDGARPLASDALFEAVIAAVTDGADAAVPGVAVTDTIRHRRDGVIDRQQLVAVQTPQGFRAESLRDAHSAGEEATDDATLVEAKGGKVVVVAGERRNLKITEPIDLEVAAALLRARSDEA